MVYKFILFSIIGITITHKAIGTECVRCVECSISPPEILTLIPDYEKTCINPKCIKATSETNVTNVSFGPCPNDPDGQRINRCGSLRGSVKFSVPNLVEATVTFYLRDCFAVNNNTLFGCYTDQNTLNDQKAILVKQFSDDLKNYLQVGDIQIEEFCIKNNACDFGFHTNEDGNCELCPEPYYGYRCGRKCKCKTNERCHHQEGCVQVLLSTEAVTTDEHTEGTCVMPLSILQIVNITIVSILFLLCVSITYVCWKYEVSCKKRERTTVHSTHHNVSGNHAHQGEAHEYVEVDDVCLNRKSSIYYIHRTRNSESSTRGSGICGEDSDGYLNPYHALISNEIEMEYA